MFRVILAYGVVSGACADSVASRELIQRALRLFVRCELGKCAVIFYVLSCSGM